MIILMESLMKTLKDARMKQSNIKYQLYAEAKAKLPMDLSAADYEEAVKKLAKKYHI